MNKWNQGQDPLSQQAVTKLKESVIAEIRAALVRLQEQSFAPHPSIYTPATIETVIAWFGRWLTEGESWQDDPVQVPGAIIDETVEEKEKGEAWQSLFMLGRSVLHGDILKKGAKK